VTLEKTPPELAADVMDKGIILTGGGALLHGFDRRASEETGMPVYLAENPMDLCGCRCREGFSRDQPTTPGCID